MVLNALLLIAAYATSSAYAWDDRQDPPPRHTHERYYHNNGARYQIFGPGPQAYKRLEKIESWDISEREKPILKRLVAWSYDLEDQLPNGANVTILPAFKDAVYQFCKDYARQNRHRR